MGIKKVIVLFIVISLGLYGYAGEVKIAAAADLKFALDEICANYKKIMPQTAIKVTYGSSGKAFTQISHGAPYDIYFSADIAYPQQLKTEGKAIGIPTPYALGRIVLWSQKFSTENGLNVLLEPKITKIAIANPTHAPYGKAAVETLKHYSIYEKIKDKLIFGENISQTAIYVQSGNADIGILALSLSSSPTMKSTLAFLIPSNTHNEIKQGYILVRNNTEAQNFLRYFESDPSNAIMKKYGFTLK